SGVSSAALDPVKLRTGQTLTGGSRALVFAAAPAPFTVPRRAGGIEPVRAADAPGPTEGAGLRAAGGGAFLAAGGGWWVERARGEAIADRALAAPAEGAHTIRSEARRLERLVGDLLDLAKLESRSFALRLAPVDLVDIAAGTVDGFRPETGEAGVTMELVSGD